HRAQARARTDRASAQPRRPAQKSEPRSEIGSDCSAVRRAKDDLVGWTAIALLDPSGTGMATSRICTVWIGDATDHAIPIVDFGREAMIGRRRIEEAVDRMRIRRTCAARLVRQRNVE